MASPTLIPAGQPLLIGFMDSCPQDNLAGDASQWHTTVILFARVTEPPDGHLDGWSVGDSFGAQFGALGHRLKKWAQSKAYKRKVREDLPLVLLQEQPAIVACSFTERDAEAAMISVLADVGVTYTTVVQGTRFRYRFDLAGHAIEVHERELPVIAAIARAIRTVFDPQARDCAGQGLPPPFVVIYMDMLAGDSKGSTPRGQLLQVLVNRATRGAVHLVTDLSTPSGEHVADNLAGLLNEVLVRGSRKSAAAALEFEEALESRGFQWLHLQPTTNADLLPGVRRMCKLLNGTTGLVRQRTRYCLILAILTLPIRSGSSTFSVAQVDHQT